MLFNTSSQSATIESAGAANNGSTPTTKLALSCHGLNVSNLRWVGRYSLSKNITLSRWKIRKTYESLTRRLFRSFCYYKYIGFFFLYFFFSFITVYERLYLFIFIIIIIIVIRILLFISNLSRSLNLSIVRFSLHVR